MVTAYSQDLRERAVSLVHGGMSCRRVASLLELGVSTVINWVARHRQTGSVSCKPMGGDRNSRLKGEERLWLLQRVEAVPDLTLEEIRRELAERGHQVGYGTVWRFFDREGVSFKKNRARRRTAAP